jgi:hypothetical protein
MRHIFHSTEAREPYVFSKKLCMIAGFVEDDNGHSFEVVIKLEEVEGGQKSNYVLKEDESTSSHKGCIGT